MSKTEKEVQQPCASCDRETWHLTLYSHVDSFYEYRIDTVHEVLQCRGCKTIGFRKVVVDYENAYPTSEDEWDVPKEIVSYPNVLKGHREIDNIDDVPTAVHKIYKQSVHAIRDQSNILAGIGLRATIESICNDRSITGRTLDKKIDGLAKSGLISQKDAERLHAIRFLGNDAAHDIQNVDPKNLLIALRIIEHLLVNIYILDHEADGKLDTIIKDSEKFIELLDSKLSTFSAGDEIPIAKILGKDVRRLHGYLSTHETSLITKIGNGEYKKLSSGKIASFVGSKEKLQHFVVI